VLDKNYVFDCATKKDIPFLLDLAKEVILKNYSSFLSQDMIRDYLKAKQCDKEIIENIDIVL
jgi:hypothetical protein